MERRFIIKIAPELCLVKADPGQIEQVSLNLSINAQDAMPEGDHLLIEAETIHLDHAYPSRSRDIQPGQYAVLSVRDTGVGIDDDVLKNIFEPFYTTKEPGKGTGLGLSTVYGIVKHHGAIHLLLTDIIMPKMPVSSRSPFPCTNSPRSFGGPSIRRKQNEPCRPTVAARCRTSPIY